MAKYVVVGASAAGIGAVEAIREVDPVGTLTVISEELCPQYSRPMISDFVSGKADLNRIKCRNDQFWAKNTVQTLIGKTAIHLNLSDRYVELDGGELVQFEKLLIATGGKPFVPKMEGADRDGVFTFTTLSDAERLTQKITMSNAKAAVVIGAGLIGVSVTEALVKCGLKVTIVEFKDKILSLILDPTASDIVADAIKRAGVTIVTGQTVQRVLGRPENHKVVGGAVLTDGSQTQCDLVIVAIGVIPRTELVAGTDIKTSKGIVVDRHMQTSVPDVYASGDVAEAYDFVLNENRPLPLWPLAQIEGKIAGYNMAGKKTNYEGGTSMSALKYFDVPVISVGTVNTKDDSTYEVLVKHDQAKNVYKKLVFKDNVIVGMLFVNDIEKAGILFHLMKNGISVKKFKEELFSANFGLATLPSSLRRKLYLGE